MYRKSIQEFIEQQKSKLSEEKCYLSDKYPEIQYDEKNDKKKQIFDTNIEEKENIPSNTSSEIQENDDRMLKYGEFSPNNPKMRVATQPYLGLGEYDHRRQLLSDQRRADYQKYTEKVKRTTNQDNAFIKNNFRGSRPVSNCRDKAVQTDIQNINTQLIQCDLPSYVAKEKSSHNRGLKIDKLQIETQNNIIIPAHNKYLDRPGGVIKNNSPRAKLMADLQSSYFPTLMGYTAITHDEDRLDKARRQEKYLAELRQQIEEKQQLLKKHKEQEKQEQEIAARKFESQFKDINVDDKPVLIKSSSMDSPVNTKDYDTKSTYTRNNKFTDRYKNRVLETSSTQRSDPTDKKTPLAKYTNSPPLTRRSNKKPYSFNIPPNSVFAKALPVKDKPNRNNSKLALNINNLTTKDNQKRISNVNVSKLEESLPISVLKAQSPVAKELINAVAVQSKTSDAMRKLEDKWQIPAVQKNIIKSNERQPEGGGQGILTQLGAIRLQLQQEQLRLDETLRKRGTSQTIQADVHHNLN